MFEAIVFFIFVMLALWVYKFVGHLYEIVSNYAAAHQNLMVLVGIIFISVVLIAFRKKRKKKQSFSRQCRGTKLDKDVQEIDPVRPKLSEAERNVNHAKKQLKLIKESAPFKRKGLLNDSEYQSLQVIKKALMDHGLTEYVYILPQVVLGSYLGHNKYIHKTINTKRADFLLVDRGYYPLCAIEINGTGHCLDDAALLRDEIKRRAIESAGIEYFSVEFSFKTRGESTNHLNEKLIDFLSRYKEKKFPASRHCDGKENLRNMAQ